MTPIVYVSDLQFSDFAPADLFDLAFLVQNSEYELRGVCLPDLGDGQGGGERVVSALCAAARKPAPPVNLGADGLAAFLDAAPEPVNVMIVGGYAMLARVLRENQPLLREKMARLFLVGGHINSYDETKAADTIYVPLDPRLRDRFPAHFTAYGDGRTMQNREAWAQLLTCGEGVIWLPRDVCVFRFAAPQLLHGGNDLCEFLRRELFWAHLPTASDRYAAADAPVLLSALPALLLATQPDPLFWMRWFRATLARVEISPDNFQLTAFETRTNAPNVYAITAVDGQALVKRLTDVLKPANFTEN